MLGTVSLFFLCPAGFGVGSFSIVLLSEAQVNTVLSVTLVILTQQNLSQGWLPTELYQPYEQTFCSFPFSFIGCEGLHSPRFIGMKDSKYLSPSCSEGPQRPALLPECSCGLALPFFSGVLRACRTSSFQETLAGTLGLSSTKAQSLMQHRGKKVPHSSVYLDPGPGSLPPSHTQFPTSSASYLRRSNLLELSWEGSWDSFSLHNSQNPFPPSPPFSNIGRVFSCLVLMIIL